MNERIFILEDHTSLRRAITVLLSMEDGFEVCGTSGCGEDALEKIAEAKPTIAVVDLSLPGISGLEVLTTLKDQFPNIRTVVLSGHHQRRYATEAIGHGASGYVVKGDPPEIVRALHSIARGETYLSARLED